MHEQYVVTFGGAASPMTDAPRMGNAGSPRLLHRGTSDTASALGSAMTESDSGAVLSGQLTVEVLPDVAGSEGLASPVTAGDLPIFERSRCLRF